MKTMILKFKWLIVLVIVIVLLIAGKALLGKQDAAAEVPGTQTVLAEKISREAKDQVLELTGTIEAQDNIIVTSKFGGKVKEVIADNGSKVNHGQILIYMEDTQQQNAVIQAQSSLNKARANLANVQKTYGRMEALYEAGAVSGNDYDNAKLAYDVALADVDLAQSALSNAQEALRDTKITSKLDGFVADCDIKEGQVVDVGTPLMTVQELSSVYLTVNINQEDITKVKQGQKAAVSADAFANVNFNGEVVILNPVADSASRSFEVKIRINNPDFLLKPGMFAEAEIVIDSPKMVISVPQTAVSGKEGVYYVFIADGNTAERRSVELGETIGQNIEVKSGLEEGEKLIVTNVNKLKDGDSIRITEEKQER